MRTGMNKILEYSVLCLVCGSYETDGRIDRAVKRWCGLRSQSIYSLFGPHTQGLLALEL